jgi:pyridoxine 4-dehydrogenase
VPSGHIKRVDLRTVDARQVPVRTVAGDTSPYHENRYNYADRSSEEVLRECKREAITFLSWYPLEAGGSASSSGTLARIAARHNAGPAQIARRWSTGL